MSDILGNHAKHRRAVINVVEPSTHASTVWLLRQYRAMSVTLIISYLGTERRS